MRSLAGIAGPHLLAVFLHPVLVASATGLLVFSLLCDLISLGADDPAFWSAAAWHALAGGCVKVLATAISGVTGILQLPATAGKRLAGGQITLNLAAAAFYTVNIWGRIDTGSNRGLPLALSTLVLLMLSAAGWLGTAQHHAAISDATSDATGTSESESATTSDSKTEEKPAHTSTSTSSSVQP